ncbi:excinuclease ABC subunit UvrA [Microbacterium sp. CFBP 8794]|uniref:excinuclease ABC subunit UvrA n=1 Tax=Microbacterium sp. CFBP 8794 TaxID=2775269 RepID=UPI0017834CCC|nr:excinuclease ABC subunit UvrA [Microbacterium sp. CFBP 8794]MBD8478057.1 excinuclease ABC subunit UvrA [Microbacterium sp. CFBP 8794]
MIEHAPRQDPDLPMVTEIRGARVHNLKNIDVDVPLRQMVAIAGVSGSGKSSLAMGVLYAEGSRRYIEALSTYTRRRMSHAARASVDSVRHVPAALALRQRPSVPGVRSTFGTSTELLNVLRIMFSRLGEHLCPNGHRLGPTIDVAANRDLVCPVCNATFSPPGAESLAFNSSGACPSCSGTGVAREIDDDALVPDMSKTIADGAVVAWSMFGLTVMPQVVAEMGVRTDVPYSALTGSEREIVMNGPQAKRHIAVRSKNGKLFELDFTYRNARRAVQEALSNATSEKGLARVNKFITTQTCSTCHGTRLSEEARGTHVGGFDLAEIAAMSLDESVSWVTTVADALPADMRPMAHLIVDQYGQMARRLIELGLGYLQLDRTSSSLSTGERQRVQLARAVRNETTGVLYVLDEPSVGLHPANVDGLLGVIRDLLSDGNSVVLVDHDVQILREADWIIEVGPGSGTNGGSLVTSGTVADVSANRRSLIGGFLSGREPVVVRQRSPEENIFDRGRITLLTTPIHTVHALDTSVPLGRITAVTGMSGSGKTTLVLDSLVPALRAAYESHSLPEHVAAVEAPGIQRVNVVDSTPIGTNARSTIATYSGVLDELRRAYAAMPEAVAKGLAAADFSYNTGSLRCPRCEGTGHVVLDVQFLPDVDIPCPDCHGSRYSPHAHTLIRPAAGGDALSLPKLLELTVRQAAERVPDLPKVRTKLQTLIDLGLGYLTLGENTPALSGGEAQRLKLATELSRNQSDTLFVLDEPSIGLHPLDTRVLLDVLERLRSRGATVIVIEHDLDVIANADYVIDMGPGGGTSGGHIVVCGTPEQVASSSASATGRYLAAALNGQAAP